MLSLNFSPFPKLISERLTLRYVSDSDLREILYMRGSKKIMKYINRPLCKNEEEALEHIKKMEDGIRNNESIFWGVSLHENPKLIGVISFHRIDKENHRAELGYILHDEYWCKGITNEAVHEVIDYGFNTMGLHSVEAKIAPENNASRNILLKNNFVKEAYFREDFLFEGAFLDTEVYSLLYPGTKQIL